MAKMMGGRALYKDRVLQLTADSYPKSGWDYVQEFNNQAYPVSVIVGDHDFLDFDNLLLKKWVTNTNRIRLSVIEKAGHIIWLDQPEEFAKQLVRHLSGENKAASLYISGNRLNRPLYVREMLVEDPDGHKIRFGHRIDE